MRTSKICLKALHRLALRYGWSIGEVDEIRKLLEESPEAMGRYWRNLALARARGFAQTEANGLLTLRAWCAAAGLPDPTWHDLDPKMLPLPINKAALGQK